MNNSVIIYITHLPIIKLIHSIILVFITELCVWINERPTFLIITNHIVLFRILTIPLLYLFYSLPNPVFLFVFLSAQINPNLQSLNIFFLNLNKTFSNCCLFFFIAILVFTKNACFCPEYLQ